MYSFRYTTYLALIISSCIHVSAQSYQDLEKAKLEYEKLQRMQSQRIFNEAALTEEVEPLTSFPQRAILQPLGFNDLVPDQNRNINYFGYNFFSRQDSTVLWDNLPTPKNYLLGPGDELIVTLWGETQMMKSYIISRDGKIYDEKVGLLTLTGKSIEDGTEYLKNQFGRFYSTIKDKIPTTFMNVSLGQMRSLNISFVGEISKPGVYTVHPFSTVITALSQVGGVENSGSLRNIQIKRDGKTFTKFDFYDYLLDGNVPENIQLKDRDVIFVPVRFSTIKIDSAVVRPGIYESKLGESINKMIKYAGGLNETSSHIVGVERIENKNGKPESFYIDYDDSHETIVRNGDIIEVRRILQTIQKVKIIGQVKSPGEYNYYSGMRVNDLFQLAGGFEDTTFWKSVYRNNVEIIRRDPNSNYEQIINIDLNNFINNNNNILLENLDRVVVHANRNYFEKENVHITGEVKIPGFYPLLEDNESLRSIILRAGGLTDNAYSEGVEIFRDSLRVGWENTDIPLFPGDSVYIKSKPGVVLIKGEVYNQGYIEFQKGKSLRYYINSAGGVNLNGNKNDILVMYPNGVVVPKRLLGSPTIRDGSIIIVNYKRQKEPFKPTEFANTTLSLLSSLVTIIVLSKQISSQ